MLYEVITLDVVGEGDVVLQIGLAAQGLAGAAVQVGLEGVGRNNGDLRICSYNFV